MSLGSEGGVPAVMNVTPTGTSYNNGGGWGGDWGAWILLFLVFSMFGWGGFGGFGGGWGGGNGALTRADLCSEFNFNGLENAVRGVQQGICDSTYALNTSILNGFHGVDNAICNLGFTTQQGFNATQVAMMQGNNAIQAQLAQCCCDNRVGQMQIQNQMAADTCAVQNTIQNTTRDVLDNQNQNAKAILDALNQNYIRSLESENQSLKLAASQSNQNAVLMAAMEANKAEILRRTGAECPTPAYVVQPPQPVNFPTNCCGQFSGWNNGCGCNSGCGC